MIPPGEKPILRFVEGKPFPDAEILFAKFREREDYKERFRKALQFMLFDEIKSKINTSNVKTQDEFVNKNREILEQINAIVKRINSEDVKIKEIFDLASQWRIAFDPDYIAREAFASYVYHDSEWSGIKLDSSTPNFTVTDGR